MNQPSKKSGVFRGRRVELVLSLELLGVGLLCACSAPKALEMPPEPLALPSGLTSAHRQYVGSLLSGPTSRAASSDSRDSFVECTVEILLMRRGLAQELLPLAPHMGLVAQLGGQEPIQGGSRLAVGTRWAQGPGAEDAWEAIAAGEWGDHLALDVRTTLLPAGTTVRMDFAAEERIEDPDNFLREWPEREAVQKGLSVGVYHAQTSDGPQITAGFALSDLARAEGDEELAQVPLEGGRPGGDFLMEEWVLPSPGPQPNGESLLWWLPSPFETMGARSVVVRIRTQELETSKISAELREESARALEAGSSDARGATENQTEQQAQQRMLVRAIQSAKAQREAAIAGVDGAGQNLRAALVFLCSRGQGSLGRDLCLVGDEAFLRGWVALIPDPASREAASEEDWVWDVERAAWVRLARDMVKEDLPDAMLALVLHHAGEAGHYPSGLEDAARNSADLQTYEQRIIQENRLFLEETSPAARVRAYDWLKRRGLEPPDWDPLGTKEERTGPLRAWLGTFESGENF